MNNITARRCHETKAAIARNIADCIKLAMIIVTS